MQGNNETTIQPLTEIKGIKVNDVYKFVDNNLRLV